VTYRSAGPLAKLAPRAPWYRLAWAWCRGVLRKNSRRIPIRAWSFHKRKCVALNCPELPPDAAYNARRIVSFGGRPRPVIHGIPTTIREPDSLIDTPAPSNIHE
jgi:hypothetical protein